MNRAGLLVALMITTGCILGCGSNSATTVGNNSSANSPSANALKGQYAFLLSGFDTTGNPMALAGSMTADGLDHINGGSIEVNDNLAISSNGSPLTGTYTLDANLRGIISFTNSIGSVAQPLAFAFTLRADGSGGDIIGVGANNFIIAGTMKRQDPTSFSLTALAGAANSFAFELGSDVPSRNTALGRFTLNAGGATSNGLIDMSVAGTGPTLINAQLLVTLATSGPDANGRSTLTLSEGGLTTNYVYYVVDPAEFILLQTDSNILSTLQTGTAVAQSLPFSATTINISASIFALSGSGHQTRGRHLCHWLAPGNFIEQCDHAVGY